MAAKKVECWVVQLELKSGNSKVGRKGLQLVESWVDNLVAL